MTPDRITHPSSPAGPSDAPQRPAARRLALAAAVAIFISACGGGGGSPPAPAASTPETASPSPTVPAPTVPAPSVPAPATPATPFVPSLSATPLQLAMHATVGTPFWPNGSGSAGGRGEPVDGIGCMPPQHIHAHAHLAIVRDGALLAVPPNIGLQGCTYEMHTHDSSGVIHIETATARRVTLGQFFSVWGQPLSADNVAGIAGPVTAFIAEGGKVTRVEGNPRDIELGPRREITLVIGPVPAEIPSYRWDPSL